MLYWRKFTSGMGVMSVVVLTTAVLIGSASAQGRQSIDVERDLSQNAYHADAPALSPTGAMTIEAG